MPSLTELSVQIEALRAAHLLRDPDAGDVRAEMESRFGAAFLDASSNDTLGLARSRGASEAARGPDVVSRETRSAPSTRGAAHPLAVSRETRGAPQAAENTPLSSASVPSLPHHLPAQAPELPRGAGASRLIHGTHATHLAVEETVANWLGHPAALLFSSGYAANVGALGALLDSRDLVVSDALNHASLIDGLRLSKASVRVAPHLDLKRVASALDEPTEGARWVVCESYYSMDGDGPDLSELRALCDEKGAALYLDEAHAFGLFGPEGAGRAREAGIEPDVHMVAFGKAIGSHGAAVAGSRALRTWLWNRARAFVFSTAPSPLHAAALLEQLERARAADEERARLLADSARFLEALADADLPVVPGSFGPVVGLILGAPERALEVASRLRDQGILVQAIRPPTVPVGESRLRLTLTAAQTAAERERLVRALVQVVADASEVKS